MVHAVARFVFCLATLALLGCRKPVLEIQHQDLLAPQGLVSDGAVQVRQGVCADETGWLLEVAPHRTYSVSLAAAASRTLSLATCGVPRGAPRERSCFTLRMGSVSERICARSDGWLARSLPVPEGVDRLEIVGSRHAVWLRDVSVRSEGQAPLRSLRGEPGRQILLISVDTLREDALSFFGGARPTPSLDAFARQAQVFRRHYAGAHWTKPSHATLLTGEPALVHGATDFDTGLKPNVRTLAERFKAAGFATEARVRSIANLDPRWGFGRGFDVYSSTEDRAGAASRHVLARAQALRDRPFFLFWHLFEAHSDFSALPYESRGTSRPRLEQEFAVHQYGCRDRRCASELLKAIDSGLVAPSADDRRLLPELYRRGVEDIDAVFGELFDELRAVGLWDRLTIVVTSDHGESLLEHGRALHTVYYEPVIRVPLLIKWAAGRPGAAAEVLDGPSSAWDLAPSLLESAGVQASDLPGRSLLTAAGRRVILAGAMLEMVLEGTWKAIWPSDPAPGVGPQLFDLAQDPGENEDLAARRPDRVEYFTRLREGAREKYSRLALVGPSESSPLSPEEIEQLRSLGYLN